MEDKVMKIFFDTEFTGLHHGTTLISIGLVSEDNKTCYIEFNDYNKARIDDWIFKNVIGNLKYNDKPKYKCFGRGGHLRGKGNKEEVKEMLELWLSQFDDVEFWNDCLSYDWVLLSDLLGPMVGVDPEDKYYYQQSLCSLDEIKSVPYHIHREIFVDSDVRKHNSLYDAGLLRKCYRKIDRRVE